jgi:hypothetical protein
LLQLVDALLELLDQLDCICVFRAQCQCGGLHHDNGTEQQRRDESQSFISHVFCLSFNNPAQHYTPSTLCQ